MSKLLTLNELIIRELVQEAGVEPARTFGPEDFKSASATNYDIPASNLYSWKECDKP